MTRKDWKQLGSMFGWASVIMAGAWVFIVMLHAI